MIPLLNSRRRAFTLIEILMSVAVASMLILLLTHLLSMTIKQWTTATTGIQQYRLAKNTLSTLQTDIESMICKSKLPSAVATKPLFFLTRETVLNKPFSRLGFYSSPRDLNSQSKGDVAAVHYRVADADPAVANSTANALSRQMCIYRTLISPDSTYSTITNKADIVAAWDSQNTKQASMITASHVASFQIYLLVKDNVGNITRVLDSASPKVYHNYEVRWNGMPTGNTSYTLDSLNVHFEVLSDRGWSTFASTGQYANIRPEDKKSFFTTIIPNK